jgi:ribonuclease G
LGKVARLLPGMLSAFIDIGLDKAAFLHVADLLPNITARHTHAKTADGDGLNG